MGCPIRAKFQRRESNPHSTTAGRLQRLTLTNGLLWNVYSHEDSNPEHLVKSQDVYQLTL